MAYQEEIEEDLQFYIPRNFDESGKILMGLLDVPRLIQAAAIVLPLIALTWLPPFYLAVKIAITAFLILPIAAFGLIGYQDLGLISLIGEIFKYKKENKKYSLKRITKQEIRNEQTKKTNRTRHKKI